MVLPVGRSFYCQTSFGRVKGYRYGDADAPAIVVQGGISGHGQLWRLDGSGWWQDLYPLFADSDHLQVLSFDYLGGLGGSDTPEQPISLQQHAQAISEALEQLGIRQLPAWVGGSFGGVLGLQLAADANTLTPQRLAMIGAAHKPSVQSSVLRSFQQILLQQCESEQHGVVLARALAMLTYRSPEEFEQRFSDGDDALQYVLAQGERMLRRHGRQANKLFTHLTPILNDYAIDPKAVEVPVQLIGFESDSIAPVPLIAELEGLLPDCHSYVSIRTALGHDGFIKCVPDYQHALRRFIPQLAGEAANA